MARKIIVTVTDNLGHAVNNAFFYQYYYPIHSTLIGNGVYEVSLIADPGYVAVGALSYWGNWFYASYVTDVYTITLTMAFIIQAPSLAQTPSLPQAPRVSSCWPMLGGRQIKGNIAVGQNEDGRLEIFVRGMDNNVYHTWQKTAGDDWIR